MPSGEKGGDAGSAAPGKDRKEQPSSGKKNHQRRGGQ
jgi:hypothetical protein